MLERRSCVEQDIDEVAADIQAAGGHAVAMPCDVTDVMAVDVLFRQVAEIYGGLDIAILNAGIDAEHTRVEG